MYLKETKDVDNAYVTKKTKSLILRAVYGPRIEHTQDLEMMETIVENVLVKNLLATADLSKVDGIRFNLECPDE